jgi:hypothetical protein
VIGHVLQKLKRQQWGLWPLRTAWLDLRYGGYAGGRAETRFAHLGATAVHDLPYRVIKQATDAVTVSPEDVLVDVGCGHGRLFNWWLSRGWHNPMIGIEIDPDVAASTRRRLRPFANVQIITGDAVDLTPARATLCFLFNPFGRAVLARWHDALLARSTAPRLAVVYINCHYLDVFRDSGRWSIHMVPKHPADYCQIAVADRTA